VSVNGDRPFAHKVYGIANGYKKALGHLLDDADIAAADLIEKLSRQCAIDADIGAVDSDDDIEVNEGDDE
jgi:hypothetical protein